MEPEIRVIQNQDGGLVEVYIDYFEECIEYACKNKVPQIHIRPAWRKENKCAQVDFKKLELLSDFLQKIAFQATLENVINAESIYKLKNLTEITGEKQKFALDLSRFKGIERFGGEYWKGLLIEKAYSLTSAVLIKFPDADMKRIEGLRNLETLHVYRSKIQSLNGIQNLPLKSLRLVSCNSLEDIEAIRELKALERLSIEKCKKITVHEIAEKIENEGKAYKLITALFGEIEVLQKSVCTDMDSLAVVHHKKYSIAFDGKEKGVYLCLFNVLADDNIKAIEDMLDSVLSMYEKGKAALLSGKDSNELIKNFINFHIEELDEIHEVFGVDSNDEISAEMFIGNLLPRGIAINVGEDNMVNCSLDFSLPEDYTDELLVVRFNDQHEVYEITHES